MKTLCIAVIMALLATCDVSANTVFTFDYAGNGASDSAGGRRYTTFAAGGALGPRIAATNSNPTGANPGPGFFYIPTGVAWQPNTTYTVDFNVYQRSNVNDNATAEFGLFSGLPSGAGFTELGMGGAYTGLTDSPPQTDLALGTQGNATITDAQVADDDADLMVAATSLIGATANTFTTGADVSGLGPQVVFLRSVDPGQRLQWDTLTVSAVPAVAVPEPSSLGIILLMASGATLVRRKRI